MRVIAGSAGGRTLSAPRGHATRPTSDRVREALFSILGPPPADADVLDLFAGAGALGIEALSRGARRAVFVDSSRPAIACIRRNLADLAMTDRAQVHLGDAGRFAERLGDRQFHWIFIDPPYAIDVSSVLAKLGAMPNLAAGGRLVVEHDRRSPPEQRSGFLVKFDSRRYGDTELALYRTESDAR